MLQGHFGGTSERGFLQGSVGGGPTTPAAGLGSDSCFPLGLLTFESVSPSLAKPFVFVCFSTGL